MRTAASSAFTPIATLSNPLQSFSNAVAATLAALTTLTCSNPTYTHSSLILTPKTHTYSTKVSHLKRKTKQTSINSPLLVLPFQREESKSETGEENSSNEQLRKNLLSEAWDIFREQYVDESNINWERLRRRLQSKPLKSDADLEKTLHWLFTNANDPFTRFLPTDIIQGIQNDIEGEMCGVGIIFNAESHGFFRTKRVIIKHVIQNSPAAEAGLMKGDQITAIDMQKVKRMSFDETTSRLLGKEGRKVLISFRRASSTSEQVELNVLLSRRKFEVPTVSSERIDIPTIGSVGYIQLREFASNTASQTRAAVRKMSGKNPVNLFVLDLRGNAGGLVDKAVEVAKVFLGRERIVARFIGRNGVVSTEKNGRWLTWRTKVHATKQPLLILVDSETASASELVAGALQDNCRAVVVGNQTYGKGSVQAIVSLPDGTGVAVTVARYRTPKNRSIVIGKGIQPDYYKADMAQDGIQAVKQLFGRGGIRRYMWIMNKLNRCSVPENDFTSLEHISTTQDSTQPLFLD